MEVETIPITEIIPYENNPRKNDKAVEIVAKSISNFGFQQPIVLDKNNVIIAGHTRLKAALKLGLTEVPIVWAENLTPEQVKTYRIMDNKSAEYAEWDENLLKTELNELKDLDYNLDLTGFSDSEISVILGENVEDKPEAKERRYKIKEGDIYQLGSHKLICGNAESINVFNKLFKNKKARLIFTDPPYNVDYTSHSGGNYKSSYAEGKYKHEAVFSDKLTDSEYQKFLERVLANLYENSTEDASIYWWFANKHSIINRNAFKYAKWHVSQEIVWLKEGIILSRGQDYHRCYEPCLFGWKKGEKHYTDKNLGKLRDVWLTGDALTFQEQLDVWYEKRDQMNEYQHPTQKPTNLALRALNKNTNKNDIVVDCFGGSGSTLIACEQRNRICYCIELDPYYCSVIIERWENSTGKKAKKISSPNGKNGNN